MISFTKDIETFIPNVNKDLVVVIGVIPNRYGLSLKIFRNKKEVKYSDKLLDDTGHYYSSNYVDRTIYSFAYRQCPDKLLWIKTKIELKLPIDKRPALYIQSRYDMTLKELDEFIEKYEPERTI